VFYGSEDLTHLDMVMCGDNDGHSQARERGMSEISEVDYWLARCRHERDQRERERVEYALRAANSDGYAVLFL
jgi:hypothetical protein